MMVRTVALGLGALAIVAVGIYLCQWAMRKRAQQRSPHQADEANDLLEENSPLLPNHDLNQTLKRFRLGAPKRPKPKERRALVAVPPTASSADAEVDGAPHEDKVEPGLPSGCQLELQAIAGPATGAQISKLAFGPPWPEISVGRVPQNDFVLSDREVSSRHASVFWDEQSRKWQVVDKGSLNGTMLNSQPIGGSQSNGMRSDGQVFSLSNGDVVTFGSSSKVQVRITRGVQAADIKIPIFQPPFAVAVCAEAMAARKGGKKLPMEDVPLVEWPLRGHNDFGIFCVFDGHAGRAAADNVRNIMPEKLSSILLANKAHEAVRDNGDATTVLTEAFHQTEAELPNEDEGCTATVLLVWRNRKGRLMAQAANCGDSHCVISVDGQPLMLTEDHRLTGPVERARLEGLGKGLREGETRLCGMNIARVLGDKFLKSQDVGLSAEPYVSKPMPLGDDFDAVGVIASDGLWDVISPKRAVQLLLEAKQSSIQAGGQGLAIVEAMASMLVQRAKLAKTQDNTTVVALDFGTKLLQ